MAFVPIYGLNILTTAATTALAGEIQIDNNAATALAAQLGSNYTFASISDGVNYEIIKINSVTPPFLIVSRGQDGTTASAFPLGACIRFVWNAEGIAAVASGATFTLTGSGAAVVSPTGLNSYNINVPTPVITASLPAVVGGSYPAWEITFQATNGCCCGGGGGGGGTPTTITGTGLAVVTGTLPAYNVFVSPPNFIAAGALTVTGTWPNITITNTNSGSPGIVDSVTGSAKIIISGSTANPVVQLATTAISAGVYNGVTFDAYGCATHTDSTYVPITTITSANSNATAVTTGSSTVITVATQTPPTATTSAPGIAQLALPTNAASNNAGDATSIVTPAGVHAVVAALPVVNEPTFTVASSFSAAPSGNYTNSIGGSSITVTLTGSQSAMITATASVTDSVATTPPTWGLAVFNGASLLQGVNTMYTGQHTLQFLVSAPFSGTLSLKTTTLLGTSSVLGYSLTSINLL